MKFLLISLFLLPLSAKAQVSQNIWGHWEGIVETHIDTATGIYVAIIDSQQVLIPNATRYINSTIFEKLEFNTDGTLLLKHILKDQSRILQGDASGELNDISEHIPGFGYTQLLSQYDGFFHVSNVPGNQETLSIWLPDSTNQSTDGSQLLHFSFILQGDTLSTRDSNGKIMDFVRVAWIAKESDVQEEIIVGNQGIPGDIDGDGDVDFTDFITFSQNFGETGSKPTEFLRTIIRTFRDTIYISPPTEN